MFQPKVTQTKHWHFAINTAQFKWSRSIPRPPVNTLSREAIAELETLVAQFETMASSEELLASSCSRARIAGSSLARTCPSSMR